MSSFANLLAKWSDADQPSREKEIGYLRDRVQPGATGATSLVLNAESYPVALVAPSCTGFFSKPILPDKPDAGEQKSSSAREMVTPAQLETPPWWRDPAAIRFRFDEIAGMAEYDNGLDREEAERIARQCLFQELRQHGVSREAAIRRIERIAKEGGENE
jgi:hypothetical protein